MSIHYKAEDEWHAVQRPYVKVNGVWTPVVSAHLKQDGVWKQTYIYDVTPPDPPILSLRVVDRSIRQGGIGTDSRWLQVGVRSSQAVHDPDLRRIRVLSTYQGKMPSTQYGGTYHTGRDKDYPGEPWSEWRYNGFGEGSNQNKDSSVEYTKRWPVNAADSSYLKGGQFYYFAAWAEDFQGNWSPGVFHQIWVPKKGIADSKVIVRETRFLPNSGGSYSQGSFSYGQLIQSASPVSRGIWFYGSKIKDALGQRGEVQLRNAQIHIRRENDNGPATSNVYIYRHDYGSPSAITEFGIHEVTKLGTISKGQGKWFDIPESYYPNLANDTIKGFGLAHKDPAKAAASASDYSVIRSVSDGMRCGEVHLVWEEHL